MGTEKALIQTKKFTRMSKADVAKSLGEILGQDSKPILEKLNKDVLWINIEQSSNVVMSQVSLRLELANFYKYLRAFGFGDKTGIDMAGEERGLVISQENVKDIELATMSFGQSNMVTPIQLLTTLCAIVNRGTFYKPYVVNKITTPEGVLVQQNQPTVIRKVLSKSTSDEMAKIMESVVGGKVVAKGTIVEVKFAPLPLAPPLPTPAPTP